MPLQLRTTTLSAAVTAEGIRCYTKTVDGEVREARHDVNDADVAKAIEGKDLDAAKQDQGWLPGLLRFHCSPDSSLCALAWGKNEQAIFYQAEDYTLRLKRRAADGWTDVAFEQHDVLPGTNLGAIASASGDRVIIVFQGSDGYLYYRCADNWKWDTAAIRICQAVHCTGIGITSWNDLVDARLYYQDDKFTIREYLGGFAKEWRAVEGFELKYKTPVGDITAISWLDGEVNVRFYLQDDDDTIIEWINEGKGWKRGAFTEASLPEADITAFVRNTGSATVRCINVLWTGQDQVLYQRVLPLAHGNWLAPTAIADLGGVSAGVGRWTGAHFSDNCPGIDVKRIARVTVHYDNVLRGFRLQYDDGSVSSWHGGQGGDTAVFELDGQDITQVLVAADAERVLGIRFATSKGEDSDWFGTASKEPVVWEYRGHALVGFMGTSGEHITGLKPFWSTRMPTPPELTLDETARLVHRIGEDVQLSHTRITALAVKSAAYAEKLQREMRGPAETAIDGVTRFVASVEYLHELTELERTAREAGRLELAYRSEDIKANVKRCQDEAAVVAALFHNLTATASKLVPEGEKIDYNTEMERENAQTRDISLHQVQKAAEAFRLQAQQKQETLKTERSTAEANLRIAEGESTKHLKDLVQKQSRKDFWDRWTLGINNRLDPFGMKQGIDKTSKDLASARTAAAVASAHYTAASNAIQAVDAELARISQLAATAEAHHASLDGVVRSMNGLVAQNRALRDAAAKLQERLERMHAEAEELDDQHTAEAFARELLDVGKLAEDSELLRDIMGDRAQQLEGVIARILGDR